MTLHTVELYKQDRRRKTGERMVLKQDHENSDPAQLAREYELNYPPAQGYRVEVHKTMVTRRNAATGDLFDERYDTPWCCSPASETYHSM